MQTNKALNLTAQELRSWVSAALRAFRREVSASVILTTTRAVRRRLDLTRPVERHVIERCIEIAVQASTALYGETWHFAVVTDRRQREAVATIYRKAGEGHRSGALPLDPYFSQLRAMTAQDPRFAALDERRTWHARAIIGISGAIMPRGLLNRLRIDDPAARGFAVGLTAHAIGTARALQRTEIEGAFAGLAMGLDGVATALLVPLILQLVTSR